jgi:hypothetical protein
MKRPCGRLRCSWKNNIKVDIREIKWEVVGWIHLAQDRLQWWSLVNAVMDLQVAYKVWNFLTS